MIGYFIDMVVRKAPVDCSSALLSDSCCAELPCRGASSLACRINIRGSQLTAGRAPAVFTVILCGSQEGEAGRQ
jgi:hypothetical protein